MQIKIKKESHTATIPTYATPGAACFDLYADGGGPGIIPATHWQSAVIDTGLSFEIPEGYAMLLFSRSGHGFKQDIRLANCVGVIDSDYRGRVAVKLTRDVPEHIPEYHHGDRIAQGMIVRAEQVSFIECFDLGETERGSGGFGSTGE